MLKVFVDGGLLGRNPSPIGGTYGIVYIQIDDTVISELSGVIDAETLGYNGFVSNNVSELYALCLGILKITPVHGLEVHFYSDSEITLGRVFCGDALNNVPDWLKEMTRNARLHLRKLNLKGYTLLAGHSSIADCAAGWNKAKNLPASKWNTHVDRMCNQARAKYEKDQAGNE